MLRPSSAQKRLLLRCLPDSLVPSRAGSRALDSRRRTLATRSTVSSEKQRASDANTIEQASSSPPIYPNSKAADRRHPHAPQLFQHFRRRGVGQDAASSSSSSSAKGSKQRVSSDAYILRNVSTDPELKQLYTALGMAADTHDAVQASKLCQLIKERKVQISDASDASDASDPPNAICFEPEEKVVSLAVMRALARYGLLEEVAAINADMLSFGFEECIDSLNHMLQAAIISADQEATSTILDRIFALEPSASSSSDRSQELANILLSDKDTTPQSKSNMAAGLTLPVHKVRNWNATTFAHMVDSACQDHNLEFALLLLSTCYRTGLTLPHGTLLRLINLCLHSDEFRAAVELADLVEQGGLVYRHAAAQTDSRQPSLSSKDLLRSEARSGQVARRLAPSIWMSILRSCAEGGYLPGVELAWSRAVTQGLLSPDDGLILTILGLAAKEGSAQMARVCLHQIDPTFNELNPIPSTSTGPTSDSTIGSSSRRLSMPTKSTEIQEWHLAPLFEAHCSARDYEGALRTLGAYYRRGFHITDRTTRRISTSIYPDKASLQLAMDALNKAAIAPQVGTHIAIVNAVLTAAVWLGDLAQALEIYRAIPSYHAIASPSGVQARPSKTHKCITPNLDTFNSLLSGCIDAADYETGVDLLKDLNKLRIQPTAVTFERMIILCLTQCIYEDAFGFMEEAKDKNIKPSRKSYEALVRKCFREKDHRWEQVLDDMQDRGYHPSPTLLRELDIDPASFPKRPRSRFML